MEWMVVLIAIVALVFKIMNIITHSIGVYLIRSLQKEGRGDEYMIYLTNLGLTELCINLLSFSRNTVKLFSIDDLGEFLHITYIVDYTLLKFSLYTTMIIISLDRMFLVFLNISYPVHWNKKKAKCCVICIWLAGCVLFICVTVLHFNSSYHLHQSNNSSNSIINNSNIATNSNISNSISKIIYVNSGINNTNTISEKTRQRPPINTSTIFDYHLSINDSNDTCNDDNKHPFFYTANYATLAFDLLFLLTAVVSYGLIFHKFKRTRQDSKLSTWQVFRRSRFYVPTLLMMTFILFIIPSDFVWTFQCHHNMPKTLKLYTTLSYALAYLSDGVIYIFAHDKVKRVLWKKLRNLTDRQDGKKGVLLGLIPLNNVFHNIILRSNFKDSVKENENDNETIADDT